MLRITSAYSQLQAIQLATDEVPNWTPVRRERLADPLRRCLPDVGLKYSKSVGAP
jgi:hypothetical protein